MSARRPPTAANPPQENSMSAELQPRPRWLERGSGEPVILLHGLLGRMDHWEATLDTISRMCRAMAVSLPIFDPRLADLTPAGLARYVTAFMDAIDLPRAVIGGNSLGGHVALEVALSRPERVSGLILSGSSGLLERGSHCSIRRRPSHDFVRAQMEKLLNDPALVTPEWVHSVQELVSCPVSARRFVRAARAARRHGVGHRLGGLQTPTL